MKYINIIKEFLKDPKKKALTQLGVWAIFFVFVFMFLNSGSDTPVVNTSVDDTKTAIETYSDMKGYTYKVTYTNLDKIDIIEGTFYNNTSLFTFNNIKYYYENSLYIIDNDSYYLGNIEYNISKIFNSNLKTIINELVEESKTTYKDGTIVTNYTIDSNKVYKYLYEVESVYTNNINVSITEKDNIVTNVVFDLTNLGLNLTKIEVEYSNINNIESLEFNKDNYTYKESLW